MKVQIRFGKNNIFATKKLLSVINYTITYLKRLKLKVINCILPLFKFGNA